jgi:uncharacterized protein YndB with AHSA1/START domain
MTGAVIDPIHLTFEVSCTREIAFSTWTGRASTWWPPAHSVSTERGLQVVFESRVGGRIFERTPAGVEHEWGRVTAWDPPSRLAFTWHLGTQAQDATDIEVRFFDVGADRTRVEIEHGGWDRLESRAAERRDRNHLGWTSVYPHFVQAIERGVP